MDRPAADPTADIKAGVTGKIVAFACRTRAGGIRTCGLGGALHSKIRRPIAIEITRFRISLVALLDGPARSLGISLDERCDLGEVVGDLNGLAGTSKWDLDFGS